MNKQIARDNLTQAEFDYLAVCGWELRTWCPLSGSNHPQEGWSHPNWNVFFGYKFMKLVSLEVALHQQKSWDARK